MDPPLAWFGELNSDDAASQATLDSHMPAVHQVEECQHLLNRHLPEFREQEPYRELVAWLRCFKASTPSQRSASWRRRTTSGVSIAPAIS